MSALKWVYLRLVCTCEKTCLSVCPPNSSLYASSTCRYLRLLASLFGQGFSLSSCLDVKEQIATYMTLACCTVSVCLNFFTSFRNDDFSSLRITPSTGKTAAKTSQSIVRIYKLSRTALRTNARVIKVTHDLLHILLQKNQS